MAQRPEICAVAPGGSVGMEFLVFDPVYDIGVSDSRYWHIIPAIIFMDTVVARDSTVRSCRVYCWTPADYVEH